ncbi:NACHT, LRR and PYD domains-containing protein 3 isoform X2 [Coregonus clupeaformis]|uniref:NACHT, LRR and PYD domains-containing protein 3 isoform X2 n=1 Tax=Coregonus clupeaformis TaxID=59861 RepID=UPI001E1C3815|nr:NACHT, LRR and PYD domains-containing protein 3 isoform X2 [Coregonus clupeaformis]
MFLQLTFLLKVKVKVNVLKDTEGLAATRQRKYCWVLASKMSEEVLEEFDMNTYNTSEEGRLRLLPVVKTCKRVSLGQCGLTEGCCSYLASVLKTPNSQLKQLELRDNNLQDSGVTLLCAALKDPNCKLQELGLSRCGMTEGCCSDLASVLCSTKSQLKQLELRDNDLQDSGVTLLCDGLADPNCKLQKLG